MKQYRLSGKDNRNLSTDPGQLAERIAEGEYSGYSRFTDSQWYDLEKDSGALGEVKSAASMLSNGNKGRFRLWKKQHSQLVRADREGTARYIFVLFDVSSRDVTAKLVEKKPSEIGRIIAGRGGFGASGHSSKGKQHKLPYRFVF